MAELHRSKDPFNWGMTCALQDDCENCAFASAGGLYKRAAMEAPKYVPEDQAEEFLSGYRAYCNEHYGDGWETAEWGWHPALVIGGEKGPTDEAKVVNTPEEAAKVFGGDEMRTNCPACGEILPHHKETCSVAPMLEEAEMRGAQKALQAVAPKTQEVAQIAKAQGMLEAAGQMLVLRHAYALVKLDDLKYITSFACEHQGGAVPACGDVAAEGRGGCCNSCWAAWWAKKVLKERGDDPKPAS